MKRTLRIGTNGQALVLGPLEQRVMAVLWARQADWLAVSDVLAAMRGRPLSYSAVKTVLGNLVDKGHVRKRSRGRANEFTAAQSRASFEQTMMGDVVAPLLRQYRNPLLAHIVDGLETESQIAELERLLAQKRAQRDR